MILSIPTFFQCVLEYDKLDELRVTLGDYDRESKEEPYESVVRGVQRRKIHEGYNGKLHYRYLEHDVALLKLNESVTFAPNIIPICLPDQDQDFGGDSGWATGWGRTDGYYAEDYAEDYADDDADDDATNAAPDAAADAADEIKDDVIDHYDIHYDIETETAVLREVSAVLYCTVLFCSILYYTVLYCFAR